MYRQDLKAQDIEKYRLRMLPTRQVFFAQHILEDMNKELKGLRCVFSGSGKIAMYVIEKLLAYGAVPITVSGTLGMTLLINSLQMTRYHFINEIIQRLMLDRRTMMKQNLGMKVVMSHFLVLHKMKLISLMPLIWLIQVVVY
ncbi:uncharacterized protein LOC132282748 isoform X2 [Cornus florida]|uniref:uncharacterized protein LOC132282748 isoform X2 n=1 Tax=Cornus florida TaxID=4283 RepID=UPI00289BEB1A|nr:uncharacterized protein LOC132282748 isoform X2 [Cornus florida]XP_059640508.1 uncharacterized protein LOC132282748 isoform X2 [Cornus florida]XP_059640509.1 uncharacterized protein LOC132282748 isoform X2 [Cornus florida]